MSTEIEIVGYLRASVDGKPEWSDDCVCVDAVYPNYDGDESVSMPICRLADALAVIAQRDARIAELEATKLHGEMVMLRTDRDRLAAELRYTIAAYVTGNKPSAGVALPERMQERKAYGHDMGGNYEEGLADGYNNAVDEVARLNPCRAQSVPDGYVLVPVEPTAKMLERAAFVESCGRPVSPRINRMYDAMLAASPSAQQKESGDE